MTQDVRRKMLVSIDSIHIGMTYRVLLVTGEYPPMVGGIADYTQRLAHYLADAGVEVGVLTSIQAEAVRADNLRVYAEVERWNLPRLQTILSCARDYDVVHLQYQAAAFDLGAAAPLLADWLRLRSGPPLVTTFHDLRIPYLFPKAGPLRTLAVRRLARRSHAVVTTNEEDKVQLSAWGVSQLTQILLGNNIPTDLPDDFDRDAWRARWGVRPDDHLLVHFGLINRSKGVPTLLRAQDKLLTTGLRAKVMFVGEQIGDSDPTNAEHLAEIQTLMAELNLGKEWTLWTGRLPAEDVAAAFAAGDVVVLPYTDGASLRRTTLITALAHGCPVVTTKPAVDIPMLRANHNVAFARPNVSGDVARRINLILRRDDMQKRLARNAAKLADNFDWSEIAAAHRKLYATLA